MWNGLRLLGCSWFSIGRPTQARSVFQGDVDVRNAHSSGRPLDFGLLGFVLAAAF